MGWRMMPVAAHPIFATDVRARKPASLRYNTAITTSASLAAGHEAQRHCRKAQVTMSQNSLPPDERRATIATSEIKADPRLIPPRGATRIVARERLLAQLLDARRKRCIVLQGPAGCGKTSSLVAWREALLPLGFDFAWLTLVPRDNDMTHFLDYLVASLAQIDPAFATKPRCWAAEAWTKKPSSAR